MRNFTQNILICLLFSQLLMGCGKWKKGECGCDEDICLAPGKPGHGYWEGEMSMYASKEGLFGKIEAGDLEAVKHLIEQEHLDPHKEDPRGRKSLHFAVEYGHLPIVQYLIEKAQVDRESKNKSGERPLHIATEKGYFGIVQYLVEQAHVEKESENKYRDRPLHIAAEKRNFEIVKYLIEEAKVNKEVKNQSGRGILGFAALGGSLEIVKYLIEQVHLTQELSISSNQHPLLLAASYGRLPVVQYLVQEVHVDPATKAPDGDTALHKAAESFFEDGGLEIIRWLIEKAHLSPFPINNREKTPLNVAKERGHQQVVDYLQQFVKEDLRSLHQAALAGDLALVKKIVASGTSVQLTTSTNQTALHYVALAEKPNIAVAEWLLQQGIPVNAMDDQGNTALSLAVERGHLDLVKMLIQAGASLDFKHPQSWSLLHLAAYQGHIALIKYLVEEIHMPFMPNHQGKTPLDVAVEKNHTVVIAYLRALLLKDFQANQEAMRKQLAHQLETQLQEPLQQIREALQIAPQVITSQNLADQWLRSMQAILQGSFTLPTLPENDHTISEQADELSQGILAGLKQQEHLLPPAQREELRNISVESLRPYTATLADELEELRQLMENVTPVTTETEVKPNPKPIQDQDNNTTIAQQQAPSSIPDASQGISTTNIEKRAVRSSKYYFVNNFRAGNVNRIKQTIKRLKESLAKRTADTLTDIQQKDIKYIFHKIQKEQTELTTLYRDMKVSISRREGDSLFLLQDIDQLDKTSQEKFQQEVQIIQKPIDNVEKAKQLLLELKAAKEELCQILTNKKVSLADYIPDNYESNFENDYSDQELVEYLNSCGEVPHTRFRKAFVEVMRMRGQEAFARIMKRLGQPAPISTQDFIELLHQVPQFDETIFAHNPKLREDMVIFEDRVKYISQIVLKIIIQSTPLPLGKTMQITSLQEIKKRIHKLTVAIEQKLRQPILLLEYPNDNNS